MRRLLITNAKALVGTHPPGTGLLSGVAMARLPLIENGWLLAEDGIISAMGPMREAPEVENSHTKVIDARGRFVLPGWCDPHTHTVFAAPREEEFVDKIRGLSYQEIADKGGGILNSARKLRAMDEEMLFAQSKARLEEMMRQGTTAVEIKSGYGLSLESELKMLRVVQRLKETLPLPIKATLLAAHALPPEYRDDRAGYIQLITDTLIPQVAAEGLADFVDVFCETNYFTVAEMEAVLEAGARHGLRGKVHVNQFTSIGGVQAAIRHGARSVDHLEVMEEADIDALAGVWGRMDWSAKRVDASMPMLPIPTLLPSCSFFLRIPYAPARDLLDRGLPVALATDHNPGSTPSGNMNLVLSLACIQLRMLPEEAINAMTLNAAAAMDLADQVGSIAVGKRANLIITRPVPSLAYLPYAFGNDHIDTVLIDGEPFRSGDALA
ncbi:MAG: imidazolonepropionase [Flavobacteriales bacterium]|nr:imidazolonepropionase [Flavobacteriales bacterium]